MARRSNTRHRKYTRQSRLPGAITLPIARRTPRKILNVPVPTLTPLPIVRRTRNAPTTAQNTQQPQRLRRTSGLLGITRSSIPTSHRTVCQKRSIRRNVLFTNGMAGRGVVHRRLLGRTNPYRRTSDSRLTCRRK